MTINKAFIWINDRLYRLTDRLSSETRMAMIFLCCLLLEAIFFFGIGYFENSRYTMLYGSGITVVLAIFCIDGKAENVVWNKLTCIPLGLFAFGIIIVSFMHPIGAGYVVFALDILIVFPFLHFVLVNGIGIKGLGRILSISVAVEGITSFLYCVWLSFNGTLGLMGARVMGHTTNPNFLGALGLIMLVTSLYLLFDGPNTTAVDILSALSAGCGTAYMITSVCRTAMLSAVGCILSVVIFIIKRKANRKQQRRNIKKMITILALAAVMFCFGMSLNDINYHFAVNHLHSALRNEQQESMTENRTEGDELQRRLDAGKDINTFTSGRTGIWKVYINNFSIAGKELSEIEDQFHGLGEWRAHNNIIDYSYRLGYVVGSLYAIFYVISGSFGLMALFGKKRCNAEDLLLVEITGCYALYAMVEVATLPFIRCVPCMFFILSAPIMIKNANRKESR